MESVDLHDLLQNYDISLSFSLVGNSQEESSHQEDMGQNFQPPAADESESSSSDEFTIFNNEHLEPVTKDSNISQIMLVLLFLR
jgi:hypothetical protein